MGNILLVLKANNFINHTIFPHRLYLYDDVMVYRKRRFFLVKEVTIAYSHIVQVDILKGILFAKMDIVNTGVDPIKLKGIPRREADKAKKIVDHKIHTAHAKHIPVGDNGANYRGGEVFSSNDMAEHNDIENEVTKYEKSLSRLRELLLRGKISKSEFNKKRSSLLKDM